MFSNSDQVLLFNSVSTDVHDGDKVEYGYKVDKAFKDDVFARQLDEAIRIAGEEGQV